MARREEEPERPIVGDRRVILMRHTGQKVERVGVRPFVLCRVTVLDNPLSSTTNARRTLDTPSAARDTVSVVIQRNSEVHAVLQEVFHKLLAIFTGAVASILGNRVWIRNAIGPRIVIATLFGTKGTLIIQPHISTGVTDPKLDCMILLRLVAQEGIAQVRLSAHGMTTHDDLLEVRKLVFVHKHIDIFIHDTKGGYMLKLPWMADCATNGPS